MLMIETIGEKMAEEQDDDCWTGPTDSRDLRRHLGLCSLRKLLGAVFRCTWTISPVPRSISSCTVSSTLSSERGTGTDRPRYCRSGNWAHVPRVFKGNQENPSHLNKGTNELVQPRVGYQSAKFGL